MDPSTAFPQAVPPPIVERPVPTVVYEDPHKKPFIEAGDFQQLCHDVLQLARTVRGWDLKGLVRAVRDCQDPDSLHLPVLRRLPVWDAEKVVLLVRALLPFQREAAEQVDFVEPAEKWKLGVDRM